MNINEILALVRPYACFYTGTILIDEVRSFYQQTNTNGTSPFSEFCRAIDNKFFLYRRKLISEILEGKACIDTYKSVYSGTYAEYFDPISQE